MSRKDLFMAQNSFLRFSLFHLTWQTRCGCAKVLINARQNTGKGTERKSRRTINLSVTVATTETNQCFIVGVDATLFMVANCHATNDETFSIDTFEWLTIRLQASACITLLIETKDFSVHRRPTHSILIIPNENEKKNARELFRQLYEVVFYVHKHFLFLFKRYHNNVVESFTAFAYSSELLLQFSISKGFVCDEIHAVHDSCWFLSWTHFVSKSFVRYKNETENSWRLSVVQENEREKRTHNENGIYAKYITNHCTFTRNIFSIFHSDDSMFATSAHIHNLTAASWKLFHSRSLATFKWNVANDNRFFETTNSKSDFKCSNANAKSQIRDEIPFVFRLPKQIYLCRVLGQ